MNLGHESVLTTLSSYGTLPDHRRAAIIKGLRDKNPKSAMDNADEIAERMAAILQKRLRTA